MEIVLEYIEKCGVLIIGNLGFGKFVFFSYLFCLRILSLFIYSRIFGYYFCMYFDKGM